MAFDGFLFNGVCYSSQVRANDAYYSSMPANAVPISESVTLMTTYKRTPQGQWFLYPDKLTCVSGTCTFTSQTPTMLTSTQWPLFPPCDPAEGFADGLSVGWLIASVLVAVAAISFMRRATS